MYRIIFIIGVLLCSVLSRNALWAMDEAKINSEELTRAIGYKFCNETYIAKIFLHPDSHPRNQIPFNHLQSRGDKLLGLIVMDRLYDLYPDQGEQQLTKMYDDIVKNENHIKIADKLDLLQFIQCNSVHREKEWLTAIKAGTCKALIGAIYKDRGQKAAKKFILSHWIIEEPQVRIHIAQAQMDLIQTRLELAYAKVQSVPVPLDNGQTARDSGTAVLSGVLPRVRQGYNRYTLVDFQGGDNDHLYLEAAQARVALAQAKADLAQAQANPEAAPPALAALTEAVQVETELYQMLQAQVLQTEKALEQKAIMRAGVSTIWNVKKSLILRNGDNLAHIETEQAKVKLLRAQADLAQAQATPGIPSAMLAILTQAVQAEAALVQTALAQEDLLKAQAAYALAQEQAQTATTQMQQACDKACSKIDYSQYSKVREQARRSYLTTQPEHAAQLRTEAEAKVRVDIMREQANLAKARAEVETAQLIGVSAEVLAALAQLLQEQEKVVRAYREVEQAMQQTDVENLMTTPINKLRQAPRIPQAQVGLARARVVLIKERETLGRARLNLTQTKEKMRSATSPERAVLSKTMQEATISIAAYEKLVETADKQVVAAQKEVANIKEFHEKGTMNGGKRVGFAV